METNETSSDSREEQELTQEALDAANTEGAEGKTSPAGESEFSSEAIAAISKQRSQKNDAMIEAAELRGKLSVMQESQAKQVPATVSPVDAYIAQQIEEGVDKEDITISASLFQQEKVYDKQLANQQALNDTALSLANEQAVSLKVAKNVHDDWQDVIDAGQVLLTKGEHLDVTSAGKDFGEVAYAKCKAAIERNKPVKETEAAPESELSKSEAEAKVKADAEAKAKADAEKVPSQDEVLKKASSGNLAVDVAREL